MRILGEQDGAGALERTLAGLGAEYLIGPPSKVMRGGV
jgi:hypothetical protein